MLEASEIRHFHTCYGDYFGYNDRARRFHREYAMVTPPSHPSFAPEFSMHLATAPLYRRDHLGFRREYPSLENGYAFYDTMKKKKEERLTIKKNELLKKSLIKEKEKSITKEEEKTNTLNTNYSPSFYHPSSPVSKLVPTVLSSPLSQSSPPSSLPPPPPPPASSSSFHHHFPFSLHRPHSEIASGRLRYQPFTPTPPRPKFWPVGNVSIYEGNGGGKQYSLTARY